jgi:aryl-alcohol dehydrogenase-like predicted oxidoreductase
MIGSHTVPGIGDDVSVLGFTLDAGPPVSPTAEGPLLAQLRRARSQGITLYDIAGTRVPEHFERLFSLAFPEPQDRAFVILDPALEGVPRADTAARRGSGSSAVPPLAPSQLVNSIREHRERLGPAANVIVETALPDAPDRQSTLLSALRNMTRQGAIAGWAVRAGTGEPLPPERVDGIDISVLSCEISLLEPSRVPELDARALRSPTRVLVRDPLGSGRLDGSRFSAQLTDRRPGAAPYDVSVLQKEYAPVLRLGFLTAGKRRTLAQAALQYLLHRPWLACVLVPLPAPERWNEILSSVEAPPLSEEEVQRVESGRT